jgi:DNA-binding transcriptional MerR regulator/methylmalonyl-CoA mutase cobalamin-binding subunit
MRVVMRRTGLSADLLRVWERRHGVVAPHRSPSGRRLYSDEDIERLRLLYRAPLAGRTIGHVAGLSDAELAELVRRDVEAEREPAGAPRPAPADVPTGFLGRCLRAVERLDALALEAVLRRAAVALPADAFLDALVAPLLARIGSRWREGALRPVHGHLAFAVVRRALERLTEAAVSPLAAPVLAVATPVGQAHELGALMAAAAGAAEGWRIAYLGAELPAEDIAEGAAQTRSRAVALSLVYPAGDAAVAHELRRLGPLLPRGVALLVGGAAAPHYRAALDEVGAVLLPDLAGLRAQLRALRRATRLARRAGRTPASVTPGAPSSRSRAPRARSAATPAGSGGS